MNKNTPTTAQQLKKVHKQQEVILQQMTDIKGELSALVHGIKRIENQLENMNKKTERKKNRLFSFSRKEREKPKETAPNPLSGLGLGDINMVQIMQLLQSPAIQKMFQKFLG